MSASIYLLSATFYIACITDRVQPYNDPAQMQGHNRWVKVKTEEPGEGKRPQGLLRGLAFTSFGKENEGGGLKDEGRSKNGSRGED